MTGGKSSRRDFLRVSGVATGAIVMGAALGARPATAAAEKAEPRAQSPAAAAYVRNRAPLARTPFVPLPLGAVRADGWLLEQLQLLADGATGNAEAIYSELGDNAAWLGAGQGSMAPDSDWERPPYYVKGLVALAYTLNDAGLVDKAERWIDWAIDSQQASGPHAGAFGPAWNIFDWWPRMPMLYAVRDFHEATGDARVLPFLTRYFRFQADHIGAHPVTSWAKARVGDNIDVVLWLYNRTGDAFLLTLADALRDQGFNFTDILTNNGFALDAHGVNVNQYMKTPAINYQRTLDAADRNAFVAGDAHLMRDHGQPIGMPSGTEALAGRSSTQGVELCATVERMQSNEQALMIVGDPAIGDQLERIAFNALPGAMDKANRLHQYYILPNQYQSTRGRLGFRDDHGQDLPPSPMSGYPCCRFNLHMGYPYYVRNMWAATEDDGVAALAYGPSRVTVRVGAGAVEATITQATDYPFEEQIRFTLSLPTAVAFPFTLRIPAWAEGPSVRVNGAAQSGVTAGGFYTIDRTWDDGDTVTLHVPMQLAATTQINNSVAIERGPLVFSLKIAEDWQQTATFPRGFNEYEIRPRSPWNYGLLLDRDDPGASITVRTGPMPSNPFVASATPITLTADARKVAWGTAEGGVRAAEVQPGPFYVASETEQITLVPFGAQNIRMTYFPEVTDGPAPVGVTFYEDAEYGGASTSPIAKGDYAVLPSGVPNDWMSSLRIPSGWTVEAYPDGGFSGRAFTFTADTAWVGADCNDTMSSFRIY